MASRILKVWKDAKTCDKCRIDGVTTLATQGTTDMRETAPGVFAETEHQRCGCDKHPVVPMAFLLNGTHETWEKIQCQRTLTS
jgi:hypothetical protein